VADQSEKPLDAVASLIMNVEFFSRLLIIWSKLDPAKVTLRVMRHAGFTKLVEARVGLLTIHRTSGYKTLKMIIRHIQLSDGHIDRVIEITGASFFDSITTELRVVRSWASS
jgi:hypothetical protein